jgi:hypothetical protein
LSVPRNSETAAPQVATLEEVYEHNIQQKHEKEKTLEKMGYSQEEIRRMPDYMVNDLGTPPTPIPYQGNIGVHTTGTHSFGVGP